MRKKFLRSVPPRHDLLYERSALLASATEDFFLWESGAPARTCTSSLGLRRTACKTLTPRELGKNWCAMPVLPRRSLFGRQACCCCTNDAKLVAASGIAPDSPRFRRGADLSQLHSQVVPPRGSAPRSSAYRAGALLLSYGGMSEEMVARGGNAPPSAGCRPVALLLSYRAW